jgi:hypothetical protein
MFLIVSGNARFAECHEHFSIRTEFEDLMTGLDASSCGDGNRLLARSVRHPDIAVAVDMKPVRPDEHAGAETFDDSALRVELENRVDGRLVVGRKPIDSKRPPDATGTGLVSSQRMTAQMLSPSTSTYIEAGGPAGRAAHSPPGTKDPPPSANPLTGR